MYDNQPTVRYSTVRAETDSFLVFFFRPLEYVQL